MTYFHGNATAYFLTAFEPKTNMCVKLKMTITSGFISSITRSQY